MSTTANSTDTAPQEAGPKGKLAIYWAASCGGCEISILGIDTKILDVAAAFDIVFCPCIMDGKVRDVERMEDGEIDVCLFNGGVRTSEQEYMAQLLRRKSKVLVAFGSCASEGCIPGLANLHNQTGRSSIIAIRNRAPPKIPIRCDRNRKPKSKKARSICRSSTTR